MRQNIWVDVRATFPLFCKATFMDAIPTGVGLMIPEKPLMPASDAHKSNSFAPISGKIFLGEAEISDVISAMGKALPSSKAFEGVGRVSDTK